LVVSSLMYKKPLTV